MTDRIPPPPADDELPPCIGARMRDIARGYDAHQRDAAGDDAGDGTPEVRW